MVTLTLTDHEAGVLMSALVTLSDAIAEASEDGVPDDDLDLVAAVSTLPTLGAIVERLIGSWNIHEVERLQP